ncbi:MAG: permease-like cell division protein FtsX [Eubacteriales bacterium]
MDTMIRNIAYAIKQAFLQIVRNKAMSFASLFSITAMMLILGLFFIVAVNVNLISENAKKQFDTVQIYLQDTTEWAPVAEMIKTLTAMPEVAKAEFINKDQALLELKARWGDNGYLLDGLETNPLPNSIRVKVNKLEYADKVVTVSKTFKGIEDIKYYQSTVDKLISITNFIKVAALIMIIFLIIVSVVVVSNTIKLTVLAREKEISIMKYVGATNWFIRGPFLTEGIIMGIFSAGISALVIGFIYSKVVEKFSQQAAVLLSSGMVSEGFLLSNLIWIFMPLGVSIGAIGSMLSMRRFLDT